MACRQGGYKLGLYNTYKTRKAKDYKNNTLTPCSFANLDRRDVQIDWLVNDRPELEDYYPETLSYCTRYAEERTYCDGELPCSIYKDNDCDRCIYELPDRSVRQSKPKDCEEEEISKPDDTPWEFMDESSSEDEEDAANGVDGGGKYSYSRRIVYDMV